MKRIFVCSPLRGDLVANIERARRLCHKVVEVGNAPYAPHIFFTQFLDDANDLDRTQGIACGQAFLEICDELWAYLPDGREPSTGMKFEIDLAKRLGIHVLVNPPCWKDL